MSVPACDDDIVTDLSHPTHAGGVVYRVVHERAEFLLVTARKQPDEWVLPKGHIEPGETPDRAAIREVREESGVDATIIAALDDVHIHIPGGSQTIRYFLMRAVNNGLPGEGRQSVWLAGDQAVDRLTFSETRDALRKAVDVMRTNGIH